MIRMHWCFAKKNSTIIAWELPATIIIAEWDKQVIFSMATENSGTCSWVLSLRGFPGPKKKTFIIHLREKHSKQKICIMSRQT